MPDGGACASEASLAKHGHAHERTADLTGGARFIRTSNEAFPYRGILLQLYWHSIGFVPNATELNASPGRARAAPGVISSIAVAVVVGAAAAAAAVLLVRRLQRRPQPETPLPLPLAVAKPPGPGPLTTLAMTDVQNSTLLWEALQAELMDECMSMHHAIVRQAIEQHSGYEVFTEGDAFAVAFHGPDSALDFAVELQVALLAADWPQELLDHPDGCELWARRNTHLQQHPAAAAAVTPLESPMASRPGTGSGGGAGVGAGAVVTGPAGASAGLSRLTAGSRKLRQLLTSAVGGSQRSGGLQSSPPYNLRPPASLPSHRYSFVALADASDSGLPGPMPALSRLFQPARSFLALGAGGSHGSAAGGSSSVGRVPPGLAAVYSSTSGAPGPGLGPATAGIPVARRVRRVLTAAPPPAPWRVAAWAEGGGGGSGGSGGSAGGGGAGGSRGSRGGEGSGCNGGALHGFSPPRPNALGIAATVTLAAAARSPRRPPMLHTGGRPNKPLIVAGASGKGPGSGGEGGPRISAGEGAGAGA
ncbi:Adenylate cyclase [Tetrabaena socialis]|uniref:Adenylate cyclase n=1 Tax=Tetrabaena socialis TaxID=47790 RepID=A0A2J8A9Z7_9CHLO|nr:Adenylate cyclase [Tetrabaena socialis]|eukprot:PNH09354.1 Adenylate cyclase [Tetrabaena socialis]